MKIRFLKTKLKSFHLKKVLIEDLYDLCMKICRGWPAERVNKLNETLTKQRRRINMS